MLCWFLLYSEGDQPHVAYLSPASWAATNHAPHPTPQGHQRAPRWWPCAIRQVPTSHLSYTGWGGHTYINPNLSVHPTPAPLSTHPFPTFVSLFLPWKFHLYHFSRFHIYAWIYDTCFSLSDWLYSLWQFLGPSTSLQMTQFHSFLWLSDIPLYICTTSSLSIHLSMDI